MFKKLFAISIMLVAFCPIQSSAQSLIIILMLKDDNNQTLRVIVGERGEYAFVTGVGSGIQGKGKLTKTGSDITLTNKAPSHRINLTGNTRTNTGNATVVVYGVGTFVISDKTKNK